MFLENRNDIDWESIHNIKFVEFSDCWKTCNGYCCNHVHDDAGFTFMKNGSGMVFFNDEYEFLKRINKLQYGFKDKAKVTEFKINNEFTLKFVQSKCSLGGVCTIPEYRPILCKIYPYSPVINLDTKEIEDFITISLPDQAWTALEKPPICTLVKDHSKEVKEQLKPGLSELIKDPYFVFHFKAIELFNTFVKQGIIELRKQVPDLSMKDFTRCWEMYLMKGDSFSVEELREELSKAYFKIKSQWT